MSGLILLVFLAVIVAWFWNKGRRRIGLSINSKTWTGVIVVFVIAMLLFWASGQGHH
ncbi:MAG: hypothetical protein JOY82_25525 [Streptosporangiaceae bacterium]|nr:hypothetical protein [Streptosporangiaceae bacterium]MBV9857847.1 hypothetical protein [Streptosporangiaceae bacterium]